MGSLLSYSGLTTKIRAMSGRFLTKEEYRELAEIKTVPLAVAWLKQKPAYENTWLSLGEEELHRGRIEQLLTNSIYQDYTKIYKFSNLIQRKFLNLYFGRYEISIMKECLNKIFDHRDVNLDLSLFKSFFDKHSKIDINRLTASLSIEEFVSNLKETEYYKPLQALAYLENPTLFDYEMTLDLYYFNKIWKYKDKILGKKDLEEITKVYGYKFDLLNLQWIYRAKKYYHMNQASIYALLIPVNYKLRKKEIMEIVEAENVSTMEATLSKTYYGKRYQEIETSNLEEMYDYIRKTVLEKESKKDPYSIVTIYNYLYKKEHEIDHLTTVLECIRYGVEPEETMKYLGL